MAASQHVQHMHKALTQMNLQIHHVISDITGATGLAIVDAILAGQRDPAELAKLRDIRIKADPETIRKSLVGNWRPEHLFTLRQSRELYPSVITSKPAISYHFKTGQRNHPQDQMMLPCRPTCRQGLRELNASSREARQGDRARGISTECFEIPLAGGGA
jgi:hypothetical protein